MGCGIIAKTASGYIRESVTNKKEVLRKNTTIIKTFIVLPEVLSRSSAVDVKSGRTRTNITNTADTKTDWVCGARNVQIKLPTKHERYDQLLINTVHKSSNM